MHCNNRHNKNESPPIACCSSREENLQRPACAIQSSSSINNNYCTSNTCSSFKIDDRQDEKSCPTNSHKINMSQNKMENYSQTCASTHCDPIYIDESTPPSPSSIHRSRCVNSTFNEKYLPSQETERDPCCSERNLQYQAELQADQTVTQHKTSIFSQPTKSRCNMTNSSTFERLEHKEPSESYTNSMFARNQENVSKGFQFQEDAKQSSPFNVIPPISQTPSPRRLNSTIANETNQMMSATLRKKDKRKKKNSKTSLKSNKSIVSDACSCSDENIVCKCHFPPAFSQFFHCTGDITGTCSCSQNI